eukprot:428492-Rhodomonas_salina.2
MREPSLARGRGHWSGAGAADREARGWSPSRRQTRPRRCGTARTPPSPSSPIRPRTAHTCSPPLLVTNPEHKRRCSVGIREEGEAREDGVLKQRPSSRTRSGGVDGSTAHRAQASNHRQRADTILVEEGSAGGLVEVERGPHVTVCCADFPTDQRPQLLLVVLDHPVLHLVRLLLPCQPRSMLRKHHTRGAIHSRRSSGTNHVREERDVLFLDLRAARARIHPQLCHHLQHVLATHVGIAGIVWGAEEF